MNVASGQMHALREILGHRQIANYQLSPRLFRPFRDNVKRCQRLGGKADF